jgi:HD-like signal output (HDOD) protein
MKVQCPSCSQTYNIPEDRLPKEKIVAFACPACKAKIRLDLRACGGAGRGAEVDPCVAKAFKERILKTQGDLPSMFQVVMKAREVMANPKTSFNEIAAVLETDQALAGRVLKMANSAYYGLSGMVSSIQHASVVLGFKTLEEVITLAGSTSFLSSQLSGYGIDAGGLWRHSLAVAVGSKLIAADRNNGLQEHAFTAGLFHDAGKIILDPHVLARKADFDALLAKAQGSCFQAEQNLFGFDHADLAAELCKKWKIPEIQAVGVGFHHNPGAAAGEDLAYILHVADRIAETLDAAADVDAPLPQVAAGALEHLGLQPQRLNEVAQTVREAVQKITAQIN